MLCVRCPIQVKAVRSQGFNSVTSACADTHRYPKLCGSVHMTQSNLSLFHFPVSPPALPPPFLSIPSCALCYSLLLTPSSSSLPLVCRLGWQDKRPGIAAYVLPLSPLTLSTAHTALARWEPLLFSVQVTSDCDDTFMDRVYSVISTQASLSL